MTVRTRRQPPPFRRVEVRRVEPVTPRLVRVTLGGPELDGLTVAEPAASVRLLLPWPGEDFVLPTWNGNEFLLPDCRRPALRTFTPVRAEAAELDIEVVLHGGGVASTWATTAAAGAPAAVSGPGRGYTVDADASAFLVAGDETAIPAIRQLVLALGDTPVEVHIEVAHPDARLPLPAAVHWHDLPEAAAPGEALVQAVRLAAIEADTRVWAAGEAAAMQRIRRHLFEERGLPRSQAEIRGYWKRT